MGLDEVIEYIDSLNLPKEKRDSLVILVYKYGNTQWQEGMDYTSTQPEGTTHANDHGIQ